MVGIDAAPEIALIDLVGTPYVAAKLPPHLHDSNLRTAGASRWTETALTFSVIRAQLENQMQTNIVASQAGEHDDDALHTI